MRSWIQDGAGRALSEAQGKNFTQVQTGSQGQTLPWLSYCISFRQKLSDNRKAVTLGFRERVRLHRLPASEKEESKWPYAIAGIRNYIEHLLSINRTQAQC